MIDSTIHLAFGLGNRLIGAAAESRVVYQLARLESLDQWWHWFTLLLIIAAIASYVVFWYRRDWSELPRPIGWSLLILRLVALLAILLFFLDLQKRSEQKITRTSRLAVLVDTSLSMSLSVDQRDLGSDGKSRIATIVDSLSTSPWLEKMRQKHDVTVYRFDQSSKPISIATFPKPLTKEINPTSDEGRSGEQQLWSIASTVAWVGTVIATLGLIFILGGLLARSLGFTGPASSYSILSGTVLSLAAIVVIGTAILRVSHMPMSSLWQSQPPEPQSQATSNSDSASSVVTTQTKWNELLAASGAESRIGEALKSILEQERGAPLAGIVLMTDGQSNAGVDPTASISDAILARVPLFPIGFGSERSPSNIRLVDVDAPKRVFPGDRFRVSALIQAVGFEGKSASVQLRSSPSGSNQSNFTIEDEQTIQLGADGTLLPIHFDVKPKDIGEWTYDVKVLPPREETNQVDNNLDTNVRVVQPKSRVLTIAGGPTREYQFVRNMLFRDKTVQSHVFLQTALAGVSQESQKLLDDFPRTLAEMSEYDCVVAFDADFLDLDLVQIQVLEQWVSQQAGGLIVVAGPVATPRWAGAEGNGDPKASLLRNMIPVEVKGLGSRLVGSNRFDNDTAWQLKFTEDGKRADYLGIGQTTEETVSAWQNFPGVFSYFPCFEAKPGALPLAYFSDPGSVSGGKLPIYLASQFFGAGRVVFQGSGEMWRIREWSDSYFDTYYTKLVRWAGTGRLLRDSDRGMLLLDKEEALIGEQIAVRAVLKDAQFQPLLLSQAEARLLDPQQRSSPLNLLPLQDPSQPGVYIGQFLAKQTGTYTVQLPIGGLANQVVLTQQVTVRVPAREIQQPQRNDPLLSELAQKTSGTYYPTLDAALQESTPSPSKVDNAAIVNAIQPQDQTNYLPGSPDLEFQKRLMTMLMALVGGSLSLEWLMRRLSKLA